MRILPGATARVAFSTIVAPDSRAGAANSPISTAARQHSSAPWRWPGHRHRYNCITWASALTKPTCFRELANSVLYSDASMRPSSDVLSRSTLDRSALWAHGISGDLPIVVVRIDEAEDIEIVRQLLRAHEYWRMKQLSADVVIINEKSSSYAQELQNSLDGLVRGSRLRLSPETDNVRGSIFLLRADLITPQERALLQTIARAVLLSRRGTLSEQMTRSQRTEIAAPTVPATAATWQTPGRAGASAGSRIFQRPGWLRRSGPRVCDRSR